MIAADAAARRAAERAARLLRRPDVVLETAGPDRHLLRLRGDRRRRPLLVLDDAARALLLNGGDATDGAGRPGVLPGEKTLPDAQGRMIVHQANLGESPIAWLARRRDGQGRPWLSPAQAAAAERLRDDFHRAGTLGRLTMAWDAAPRAAGPRGPGVEPAEQGRAAKARIARALAAVGPGLREILEQVCLAGTALEAAERGLGLPRRSGKTVLRLALDRLAAHYGAA